MSTFLLVIKVFPKKNMLKNLTKISFNKVTKVNVRNINIEYVESILPYS